MKKYLDNLLYLILISLMIVNCDNHNVNQTQLKAEIKIDTVKVIQQKKKTFIDTLINEGVLMVNDSIDCGCGVNVEYVKFSVKIDSIIRLCEYSNKLTDKLYLTEFSIFDCENKVRLFENNPVAASCKIIRLKKPFTLLFSARLPNDNGEFIKQDYCKLEITNDNDTLKYNPILLYKPSIFSQELKDSVIFDFENYSKNIDDYPLYYLDVLSTLLFQGALSGDSILIDLFENGSDKLPYDGAYAEYMGDLNYLYNLIKN